MYCISNKYKAASAAVTKIEKRFRVYLQNV